MKKSRHGHHYNWKPSLPDFRDKVMKLDAGAHLPPSVDLRAGMPPVYDQGQLGSCTANAIGAAFEFEMMKQKENPFVPSRLFTYFNERSLEGTVNDDAGAVIRDGLKVVAKQGVCPETLWPYDITKFKQRPPEACYAEGLKHQVTKYESVTQDLNSLKACLAAGFPIVFGIAIYEGFESPEVAKTGIVHLPKPGEKDLGGHAILIVGYIDQTKQFIVRNSWGTSWGQGGYFFCDYAYITNPNLSSDFWAIQLVE